MTTEMESEESNLVKNWAKPIPGVTRYIMGLVQITT